MILPFLPYPAGNEAALTVSGAPPPPFSALINFRLTSAFVTDDAGQTYALATDSYPTSRAGLTFGWEVAPQAAADRTQGIGRGPNNDPRLAGVHYTNSATPSVFRVDLASAGTFNIVVAFGDDLVGMGPADLLIKDDATAVLTLSNKTTTGGTYFFDATGTEYTDTSFKTSQTPVACAFSSTICRLTIAGVTSHYAQIAHLGIYS